MLAINGTDFSEFKTTEPIAQHIKAAIKTIRKQRHWRLIFHPSRVQPGKPGIGALKETSSGVLVRASGKYRYDGMEWEITFYRTIRGTDPKNPKFVPRTIDYNGPVIYDSKEEADLLFYMLCVSPHCAKYDDIAKYQNPSTANYQPYYMVEDIVDDARIENETDRLVTKANIVIFNDDFGANEERLRDLASAYGVIGGQELDIDLIRLRLKGVILKKTNNRYDEELIRKFVGDVSSNESISLRAKVQIAVEKKLVVIKKNKNNRKSWYYAVEGIGTDHIMTVPIGDNEAIALFGFLSRKQEKKDEFVSFVDAKTLKEEDQKAKKEISTKSE